jgi:hypothetical protein
VQGDHERRVRVERADAGQQASGGRGIETFGRLVQEQHVGAPEQALGDAEAATLATGESLAAGADRGVQAGGEGGDGVVERGGGERPPELGVTGGGISELEVVADRPVEDVHVLGD